MLTNYQFPSSIKKKYPSYFKANFLGNEHIPSLDKFYPPHSFKMFLNPFQLSIFRII